MIVRVKLFAVTRQIAGRAVVEVEVREGATVGELRRRLAATVPGLAPVGTRLLLAVNRTYANDEAIVPADAEVACIPPVSGG
jgi:molybdopterin converting factor subunit 1